MTLSLLKPFYIVRKSCVVALFILTRHVKQKIHSDSSALCMLKHPSAIDGDYVLASGDVGKYQGVYLFFDAAAES